ncbi:MAG TPA: hypothetical protein VN541_07135 [Tepidisphaeraceae bacterium]|nr:hypothetical protein [Tepidisphaeraceae bacterium]
MSRFTLHPGKHSTEGTFFDVIDIGDGRIVATLVLRRERPQLLEVCHPRFINRVDGTIGELETELLAWLSNRDALAGALASVYAGPVGSVGWIEWVCRTV